ncbi:MAG: YaaW family protein [Prochloraceae cyanobacterium]|nr:YaaW family protein [Prochloraceae cyanobacterium]
MDELRTALELATEEELQQLTQILFCRRFNPLDYFQTPQPLEVQSQDWDSWLDAIEKRFRYLASDGVTVLRGRTSELTYRQALLRICRYLKIAYSKKMSTIDIEAEVFLHLLDKAWKRLPASEQKSLTVRIQKSIAKSDLPEPLPVQLQHNPVNLLLKGSSALAVNSVLKPWLLSHIARQFAIHFANYQVAKNTLIKGGIVAAEQFQNYLVLQTAKRGMAINAARYGAVRSIFTFVGPLLWTWLLMDLGWRSIATNYTRVIPTVFTLAQIRLTRSDYLEFAY